MTQIIDGLSNWLQIIGTKCLIIKLCGAERRDVSGWKTSSDTFMSSSVQRQRDSRDTLGSSHSSLDLIGEDGGTEGSDWLSPCRGTSSLSGGRGSPSPPVETSISGRSVDLRVCHWFLDEEETDFRLRDTWETPVCDHLSVITCL